MSWLEVKSMRWGILRRKLPVLLEEADEAPL